MPDQDKPAQPTPAPGNPAPETKPHPVDQAAQEEAGKVRKESGGYD